MTHPVTLAARHSPRREADATHAAVSQAVLDGVDVGILACDISGQVTVFNRVCREFHGASSDGSMTDQFAAARLNLYRADGMTPLPFDEMPLGRSLREHEVDGEMVIAPVGLPVRLVTYQGRAILGNRHQVVGAVVVMRDVTEQRAAERRLRENALRDPLTNLPNRLWLFQATEQALREADATGDSVALLFVDLDGFKLVNDDYGHARGDQLLVRAAERLRAAAVDGEPVTRLGGDEFVLLCPGLPSTGRAHPTDLARRIISSLSQPYTVQGHSVTLSASVGIALADDAGLSAEQLVGRADAAMYAAKRAGRSQWALHSGETVTAARAAARIEKRLREALEDGSFEVHYQPIHRLADRVIVGVEALSRLPDGEGGYVSPEEFIPVAEATGLIGRVGETVVRQATRECAAWKQQLGGREFSVGVNLSVRELADPLLVSRMTAALRESGLDPQALVMELTESIFSDSAEHNLVLDELRALGPQLVIDDFGTGYSSLSYLRRFTVDGLKIDRSFVADIANDRGRWVTEAIVAMTLGLGGFVVAEGIETEAQLTALVGMGCVLGQGYLLSRPLPAGAMTALLTAPPRRPAALLTTPPR
jgi:diguanylate cyclase (GGDEF)-like protein